MVWVSATSTTSTIYNVTVCQTASTNLALQAANGAYMQQARMQQTPGRWQPIGAGGAGEIPPPPQEETQQAAESRQAASERARGLLLSMLNHRERKEFEDKGVVSVRGASGTRYRVKRGRVANIEVLHARGDEVRYRLCIHPVDPSLPIEDVMLAQLLHLKADEAQFLEIANRHG